MEAELGLKARNAVRTSAAHHATIGERLLPMAVGRVMGERLEVTFGSRDRLAAPIGMAIARLFPEIPGGRLVFFTSGAVMRKAIDTWRDNGTWDLLAAAVGGEDRLYVEDASEGAAASAELVKRYKADSAGGADQKAALFAVLRGRSSEGADFSDATARAVFVIGASFLPRTAPTCSLLSRHTITELMNICAGVGIPNLPIKSPIVEMKMAYNNRTWGNSPSQNGQAWYRDEAAVPVAQAIGRVIRHAGDFGAIFLFDSRFCRRSSEEPRGMLDKLPQYISKRGIAPCRLRIVFDEKQGGPPRSFGSADVQEVQEFFRSHMEIYLQQLAAKQAAAAAAAAAEAAAAAAAEAAAAAAGGWHIRESQAAEGAPTP